MSVFKILFFCTFLLMAGTQQPETGYATYYNNSFHGKKTANGEIYDKNKYTAAHKTLPFGTIVKVSRLNHPKRYVLVRINDRGPYGAGRIIDLSRVAAKDLGLLTSGKVKVKVEVISGIDWDNGKLLFEEEGDE